MLKYANTCGYRGRNLPPKGLGEYRGRKLLGFKERNAQHEERFGPQEDLTIAVVQKSGKKKKKKKLKNDEEGEEGGEGRRDTS